MAPADMDEHGIDTGPELLAVDELAALSDTAAPAGGLAEKLVQLLHTPFISNGAAVRGAAPRRPVIDGLGPVLRAVLWNIDHGRRFEWIRLALTDPEEFEARARDGASGPPELWTAAREHLRALQDVDLLILNEADLGVARSGYRDVARELADALAMNYAYGVEFVEVDPVHFDPPAIDAPFRGLHGSAILSRYRIRSARIHRLPVCHDWYENERNGVAPLENGRRWAANTLFLERIHREIRHGSRMALIADLDVPALPDGAATVVAVQLESKSTPECRRRQMEDLLRQIHEVPHPVILAGDLNTSGVDARPVSFGRQVAKFVWRRDPWARRALQWLTSFAVPPYVTAPVNHLKNMGDPTAIHIPVFAPNAERRLFDQIRAFRFADGGAFDFRGARERTLTGKGGSLANSNARSGKGFRTTYTLPRQYAGVVGSYKLDWFLIKPYVTHPRKKDQSYRFAPHFPRTMAELNAVIPGGLSDHHAITVDLPLGDPSLEL